MIVALAAAAALALPFALAPVVQAAGPCGPESNPIVCENSKPGAHWSEWEISGAGDGSIQGFSTDISVNAGNTIDFKVDTEASAYDIDIYRTGWYQGLGARKVASVEPSAALPQDQDECLWNLETEFMDCGTWDVSASWDVPADAVSGVYLAKLTRQDTGGASHITFVVRNDGSTSDVLFQTSDTTWHAYNTYGGSDFYRGADNGRAYKLSYNRPFATRGGIEARDFYFGAEYPLVRFMERNGYDVTYFSGVDTDRFGDQLMNHKTFLSVGHDEYWSGRQRENVEAARDAGVNLQFLSGNEMYWRVRYEDSPADPSGGDHRTMVSYKETWSNEKIDPSKEWTGTWRDPRFASTADGGGLPENAVTGTAYVMNHGSLPVTVDSAEGDRRLWRNTGLEDLPADSSEELAQHTIGYESNEDLPNGFRPPGLIHLSTTTGLVPQILVDFGNTVEEGETTHHLTLYRAESGALVFSAGSIQWTWGLDEWHDGDGAPADPRMQQAQVNLFADMGVQPETLMDGLVPAEASTDTTPPTVQVTDAPTGPVPHGEEVTLSGTATDGTGPESGVVAGVEFSLDAGATWMAAEGTADWTLSYLQPGLDEHTVLVRAIDDNANYPSNATRVTTTVEGPYSAFGQQVPETPDTGDPQGVELGLRFSPTVDGTVTGVRFYQSAANTGSHAGSLWSLDGRRLATVTFPASNGAGWKTATFQEPVEVLAGTEYVVSYTAPAGRYSADSQYFAYRGVTGTPVSVAGGFGVPSAGVFAGPDQYPASGWDNSNYYVDAVFVPAGEMPLSMRSMVPADQARSVPVTTTISAVMSRDVDPDSVAITVTAGQEATEVAGTTSYEASSRTVTFTPADELAEGTKHTVTVAATGANGDQLGDQNQWEFHTWTSSDPLDCPCGLLAETVLPGVSLLDDGLPLALGTAFTTTVPGQVTALEFYRAPGNNGPHTGTLFDARGTALANVEFPSDSPSGWQQATLDTPVTLDTGTEYVVAYSSPSAYSVTAGHWTTPRSSGPLQTAENAGRYVYGAPFPQNATSSNYLVDVRFEPVPEGPVLVDRSPAPGASGVDPDTTVTATFDQELHADATLGLTVNGADVPGASTRSADRRQLIFTPASPLSEGTQFTATATGVTDAAGTTDAQQHQWSFRTASDSGTTQTFLGNTTPQVTASGEPYAVELGVQLTTDRDITVHALRYYRGTDPGETGTGSLWDADGTRLAQVDFPAPTGTGWQTAFLDSPVDLAAGTTFTVSRHSPGGGYVYTSGAFNTALTEGALTLAGDNGRFRYGDGSAIPTKTWGGSNYFVDLEYTSGADDDSGEPTPGPSPSSSPTPTPGPSPSSSPTPTLSPSDPPSTDGFASFLSTGAPAVTASGEPYAVELGVQLTTDRDITVHALRYYRGTDPGETGTGSLWDADGTRLAQVDFPAPTGTGWQTAFLDSPVDLAAGTTFTVSRHSPGGGYVYTSGAFNTALTEGALTLAGDNGRFRYGDGSAIPTKTWGGSNYFVDLYYAED
ncbi:DUF4082 domain-containing protein [Cellulosimicrobium funkei]|nr:DUF4082 domain-containing protein [Cellulosimicrobium funkei]